MMYNSVALFVCLIHASLLPSTLASNEILERRKNNVESTLDTRTRSHSSIRRLNEEEIQDGGNADNEEDPEAVFEDKDDDDVFGENHKDGKDFDDDADDDDVDDVDDGDDDADNKDGDDDKIVDDRVGKIHEKFRDDDDDEFKGKVGGGEDNSDKKQEDQTAKDANSVLLRKQEDKGSPTEISKDAAAAMVQQNIMTEITAKPYIVVVGSAVLILLAIVICKRTRVTKKHKKSF